MVFIDALVMKIRQGQVANRPVYVVVGISLDGERDVLGMWTGTGGEGAKQWASRVSQVDSMAVMLGPRSDSHRPAFPAAHEKTTHAGVRAHAPPGIGA